MRSVVFLVLAVILTVIFGLVFSLSDMFSSTSAVRLSAGWTAAASSCSATNTACISDNLCLAPSKGSQKGWPFRYYGPPTASSCSVATNHYAEALDWVLYIVLALIVAFIGSRFVKPRRSSPIFK